MYIKTLNTKKYKTLKNLNRVVSPFKDSVGGLFDQDIFGSTIEQHKDNQAYIELGRPYVHPLYINAAKMVWRDMIKVVEGSAWFTIDPTGELIPADSSDPGAGTGLSWFYDNFEKIKSKKLQVSESDTIRFGTKLMRSGMNKVDKEHFFIYDVIVLPIAYRDEDQEESVILSDELNTLYADIIKLVQVRNDSTGVLIGNPDRLDYIIQSKLNSIYDYLTNSLFGDGNEVKRVLQSRVVDHSCRLVLIPAEHTDSRIGKSEIDLNTAGIPLSRVVAMYPSFVIVGIRKFLANLWTIGKFGDVELIDVETVYNQDFITEMIDRCITNNIDMFGDVRLVENHDFLDGSVMLDFNYNGRVVEKPLKWMEMLYIVCKDYIDIDNKHLIITRYPTEWEKSTKAVKIFIMTLTPGLNTGTVEVLGVTYKDYFPVIDDRIDYDHIDKFVENGIKLNAALFGAMGADCDGDAISVKPVYSVEANKEIQDSFGKMINLTSINGDFVRDISRDAKHTMFTFTREPKKYDKPKNINPDHPFVKYLTTENMDSLDFDTVMEYCGSFEYGKTPTCALTDRVVFNHKGKKMETTIGRLVISRGYFNTVWFSKDVHLFINEVLDKKGVSKLYNKLVFMALEKKLVVGGSRVENTLALTNIVDAISDFNMKFGASFNASVNLSMMMPDDDWEEFRSKAIERYTNPKTGKVAVEDLAALEKEIIDYSKKHFKDNTMMELYDSGAKAGWSSDFKELNIFLGATPALVGSEPIVSMNSLTKGMDMGDMVGQANAGLVGGYSKSKATAQAGYIYKKIANAFQTVKAIKGDCGSKQYLKTKISRASDLYGRYILDRGKLVEVTSENIDKYLGVEIDMRSPIFCKQGGDNYCETCVGSTPFKVMDTDTVDIGLYTVRYATTLLNLYMKANHTLSVEFSKIDDINKYIE